MLIIPAILESFASLKDKTIKLVFTTNELTPEQLTGVALNVQRFGFMAFKEDLFTENEKVALKGLKSDYDNTGKSPSQRLRAVLFVNWQQDHQGFETFDQYYAFAMGKIIEHYKSKLDE